MSRFEMVGTAPEFDGNFGRLHLFACAASPSGEPVGEFYEAAVSPWFPIEDVDAVTLWFFDWYRERQGFSHPEDPRGGKKPVSGAVVLVADLVTGEDRVHFTDPRGPGGGVGAEPPRGRC